jgi:hypothetical protein
MISTTDFVDSQKFNLGFTERQIVSVASTRNDPTGSKGTGRVQFKGRFHRTRCNHDDNAVSGRLHCRLD